jgi:hypothetical protein
VFAIAVAVRALWLSEMVRTSVHIVYTKKNDSQRPFFFFFFPQTTKTLILKNKIKYKTPSEPSLLTPLHVACSLGAPGQATAKVLLDHGGDPSLADAEGNTALHIACLGDADGLVELLCAEGAAVSGVNGDGCLALHIGTVPPHPSCAAACCVVFFFLFFVFCFCF